MDRLHRMDFYPQDYLCDRKTRGLTAEEHGVYLLLLMHGWIDGPLPESLEELADLIPGGKAVLDRCWPRVSRLFSTSDGRLLNARQERERALALALREEKRRAGIKSGEARRKPKRGDDMRTPAEQVLNPHTRELNPQPHPHPLPSRGGAVVGRDREGGRFAGAEPSRAPAAAPPKTASERREEGRQAEHDFRATGRVDLPPRIGDLIPGTLRPPTTGAQA